MASSLTGFTLAAQGISLAEVPTPARSVPLPPGSNVGTQQAFGSDLSFGGQFNLSPNPSISTPTTPAASSASVSSQLRYPNTNWPSNQDFILFTALKYGKSDFKTLEGGIGFSARKFTDISPTVCLPIQNKIQDQNLVNWTSATMNALQIAAAGLSESFITDGTKEAEKDAKSLKASVTDPDVRRRIDLLFAEKASSTTGLLSRLDGSIANPNLELLFQGPDLRPFSFNFIMSARDESEATMIRRIIRFFKQNMAVQRTESDIFLKSPNVFRVQYKSSRANGLHPSINRIKECALQSLNVDYTPAGTYSTFNDAKSTMTAYTMSMQFTELEPIFADEYNKVPTDEIGF